MSLHTSSIEELRASLDRGDVTAQEVCEAFAARLTGRDADVGAFSRVLDTPRTGASTGPLAGIPYGLKSNIVLKDEATHCGSRVLENYRPPYDAAVVERLARAGAVVLGQTNLDEFAMGSSTENSAYGPTRNPWNLARTPGGSSGGSAAAVAADMVPFALGSDTGGSIRQPAGFCGVVGLKPTYGRVSRYGLVAFASSLDQIGPLARTVRDTALVYHSLAGHDSRDSTSLTALVENPLEGIEDGPKGLRLGVPRALLAEGVDADVRANFDATLDRLVAEGAELVEVELPTSDAAIAAYYIVATAEASSNLARYDGVRYGLRVPGDTLEDMERATRTAGFGAEVRLRILLGTYVLSAGYYEAYYRKASQVRTLLRQEVDRALEACDAIVTPTSPTPAFELGERTADPLQMYLSDIFTTTANLTGLPAVAVPSGLSDDGLPLSLQLLGRALDEPTLLRAARAVEHIADFATLRDAHLTDDGGA